MLHKINDIIEKLKQIFAVESEKSLQLTASKAKDLASSSRK